MPNGVTSLQIMTKVAIVCTSADKLEGGHPTGLWLEECAASYYIFKEAGYEVDIVSVKGGVVPIDAGSLAENFYTAPCKKMKEEDSAAWALLQDSKKLDAKTITDYDAVLYAGGHGTCIDFATKGSRDNVVTQSVEAFNATKKPLAAVCHGVLAFAEAKNADGNYYPHTHSCTETINACTKTPVR